jgi:hypothetical protein
VSIHADDEFSLRIALEGELDDVVPADGLAGVVITRYRRTRRRRVAGAVGLVVVAAGIGVPLGLAGGSGSAGGAGGKPAHGGAPEHGESFPRQHAGAASGIGWRAEHLVISVSSLSPAGLVSLTSAISYPVAA